MNKEQDKIIVGGNTIDAHTRCIHYHSALDIIAIKMPCCNTYYPCIECHNETAGHPAAVWPGTAFDTPAILCGQCYNEMTIAQYLSCNNQCPFCGAAFNPKCCNHYHLYFEQ
ncbi:MAG: CHY zinc finger protein [Ferruginibacter sp.]